MAENVDDKSAMHRLFNPHKAGLEHADKERVNRIVFEMSKNSSYYKNEERKEQKTQERIQLMLDKYALLQTGLASAIHAQKRIVDQQVIQLEASRDLSRSIVHIDMDAFYAAVETRDQPELAGKPMGVGGTDMLSTANYEARTFGVRAAMPGFIALELCPQLIIVKPNFEKYRLVSSQVQEVLKGYDANFDMMSLDEAYLDITDYMDASGMSRDAVVEKLRTEIHQATGLTASAGIAANRMLAKICSDRNKPNGQFELANDRQTVLDFMHQLPVRKVSGIGKVTERILQALEITSCQDIEDKRVELSLLFTKCAFDFLLRVSLGIGSTTVSSDWTRKSLSVERTFATLKDPEGLKKKLYELSEKLAEDLADEGIKGKTVTLKLKSVDFQIKSRAKTVPRHICTAEEIYQIGLELLTVEMPCQLRLMGIRMSSLDNENELQESVAITKYFKPQNKRLSEEVDESKLQLFTCPICGQVDEESLAKDDNTSFNQHIDTCLNKETVTKLKRELTNNSKPVLNPSKKVKHDFQSRLDDFFDAL